MIVPYAVKASILRKAAVGSLLTASLKKIPQIIAIVKRL